MPDTEIDTTNKFLVAVNASGIVFLRPIPPQISRTDALLLAAYLVALADEGEWEAVLTAVQNT